MLLPGGLGFRDAAEYADNDSDEDQRRNGGNQKVHKCIQFVLSGQTVKETFVLGRRLNFDGVLSDTRVLVEATTYICVSRVVDWLE